MVVDGGLNSVVETVSMLGLGERRRLERDLHDGAQQRLVSLALTLRMAREKLGPDAGEAGRLLDRSRQELDEALKEIRELARGIHPTVLSDRGLGAAVEALAHRAPLPVEVGEPPPKRLTEQVELAAYFVGRNRGPTRGRLQTRAGNDCARQHPMPTATLPEPRPGLAVQRKRRERRAEHWLPMKGGAP